MTKKSDCLATEIELQHALKTIRMAERYLRYLKKEGEFKEPRWWQVFSRASLMFRLPPMFITSETVRRAEETVSKAKGDTN